MCEAEMPPVFDRAPARELSTIWWTPWLAQPERARDLLTESAGRITTRGTADPHETRTSSAEQGVDEPLREDAFIDRRVPAGRLESRFGSRPVATWGNHAWPESRSAPGASDKETGMSVGQLLLSATGIVKAFRRRPVLEDASLEVRAGEAVALVGENGAGKTTLLRICAGLLAADAGEVRVAGRVGYCPQEPGVFELLTAVEHMVLFGRAMGLRRQEALTIPGPSVLN